MALLQSLPEPRIIAPGVTLLFHPDKRFKRCLVQMHLDRPLDKLAPARTLWAQVAGQGTQALPTRRLLSRRSEHLYGAGFYLGGQRLADSHRMTLELNWVADRFLPAGTSLAAEVLNLGHALLTDPLRDGKEPFSAATVSREKAQLLREIKAMEDDRDSYAEERFLSQLCAGEPMGLAPWGNLESVAGLGGSQLETARQDLIQNATVTMVAVGPIQVEVLVDFLESHWGSSNSRQSLQSPSRPQPKALREIHDPLPVDQAKFHFGFRFQPPTDAQGMEELGLANLVLGGGIQGRLFKIIREQRSLAYGIGSRLRSWKGILSVSAGIDASAYAEVRDEVLAQIKDLAAGGAQEEELEMARAAVRDSLQGLSDAPGSLASYIGREHLLGLGRAPADRYAGLEKVVPSQIAEVASAWQPDLAYLLAEENQS